MPLSKPTCAFIVINLQKTEHVLHLPLKLKSPSPPGKAIVCQPRCRRRSACSCPRDINCDPIYLTAQRKQDKQDGVRDRKNLKRINRTKSSYLAILLQVNGERFNIVVKAQIAEGDQQIIPIDSLAILGDTALDGLAAYKGYELRDALLYTLSGVFGDFAVLRHRHLHYLDDVADGKEAILFAQHAAMSVLSVRLVCKRTRDSILVKPHQNIDYFSRFSYRPTLRPRL